ncbi:MAG: cell wall anchor protein, partial [Candidatus Eisenbacteria bacterium]|nr:cell wall anchor protein [Candidatus Eisenbacteria bacterium]
MTRKKPKRPGAPPQPPPKRRTASRRRWIWAGAALVLAALAVAPLLRPQARAGIPAALRPGAAQGFNVLLITLDTTRADHLGCYGYADVETP